MEVNSQVKNQGGFDLQAYAPFRTKLVTPAELRELTRLRPHIPVIHAAVRWALMIAIWACAAIWPHPAVVAVAVVLIGVNYYGLLIIGHDGLHRRVFESTTHNDRFNDMLVLAPICAITRLNRINHMDHHRDTCLDTDPDRHKYVHHGKEPLIPFLVFISGIANLAPTLRNIFIPGSARMDRSEPRPKEPYRLLDFVILIAWQAALIGGLTWFIGWWAYPVLWLLPVYAFAYRADLTRVFCEHAMLTTDSKADAEMRLVTYRSNWLERQFFAPHNMNVHMAHHLWPSVPYYNLPKADRLIRRTLAEKGNDPRLVWRDSYAAFLLSYMRWRSSPEGRQAAATSAAVPHEA